MHDNLMHFFSTRGEAYGLLVKHQKRDQTRIGWIIAVVGIVVYAFSEGWIDSNHWLKVVVTSVAGLLYVINLMLDLSNREFALHVMDWMEDIEAKRTQGER
jgi:peptidoglycan/LPS O-acetylase OafA/YrhL